MKLDEDAIKWADAILSVVDLAGRNFPADTEVKIETSGSVPAKAHVYVPSYVLRHLIEAGRLALRREAPDAHR